MQQTYLFVHSFNKYLLSISKEPALRKVTKSRKKQTGREATGDTWQYSR